MWLETIDNDKPVDYGKEPIVSKEDLQAYLREMEKMYNGR